MSYAAFRNSQHRLLLLSVLISFSHSHTTFPLMVRMTRSIRLSQTRVLSSSDNSGNVMCPPLGNLIGDVVNGVDGACAPHSSGVSFEHLVRELASQISGQGEQFSLFSKSMADTQRQLRELTDACTPATEWIRSHEERANGIDKSLESLRVQLDALQSASVSSVQTKSVVSDWPQSLQDLRAPARTDGSNRAKPPARVRVVLLLPSQEEDKALLFLPAKIAPSEWYQQDDEFLRSAVLGRFLWPKQWYRQEVL